VRRQNALNKNTLANTTDILHPAIAAMLKKMEDIFSQFGVEFYLAGAVARDIQLSAKEGFAAKRKTEDVDIAVMIADEEQFNAIKEALIATGEFEAHEKEAIKLIYQHSIEADLLPFGKIESELRETRLSKPALFVMDMPGFREVYKYVETVTIAEDFTLNVCSLEGFIILKLIANDDKPSRTKDITDIEHILDVYFELNEDEMYEAHNGVMDLYDTDINHFLQLVSARVIGRKIKTMLNDSEDLKDRVRNILANRPTDGWQAMLDGMNDE